MKTKRSHLYKIAGLGLACALLISSAWHPSVAQTAPAMPARLEARNGVLPERGVSAGRVPADGPDRVDGWENWLPCRPIPP